MCPSLGVKGWENQVEFQELTQHLHTNITSILFTIYSLCCPVFDPEVHRRLQLESELRLPAHPEPGQRPGVGGGLGQPRHLHRLGAHHV